MFFFLYKYLNLIQSFRSNWAKTYIPLGGILSGSVTFQCPSMTSYCYKKAENVTKFRIVYFNTPIATMSYTLKAPRFEETERDTLSAEQTDTPQLLNMTNSRRFSVASTDSRMSDTSARSRRFSTAANQVEKTRRLSKSFANYKSPYSKKTINDVSVQPQKVSVKFENTYQTSPKQRFPVREVRQIILKTLQNAVGDEVYGHINPTQVSKTLSQLIKDQVKSLNLERFKIVCMVTIGEIRGEGLRVASRCLWNEDFDRFASASVQNATLFAVGTVYGIYFE